ncbi:MAG: hypothetical protein K0S65_76, partial [Labilithrix sp.]|nr:hypothetical protein [Labilithrix sp.]
ERAVFGPGEIDARVEQDVERLAPEEGNGPEPSPKDDEHGPNGR